MDHPSTARLHRWLNRLPGGHAASERLSRLEQRLWPEPQTAWPALPAPVATAMPSPSEQPPEKQLQALLDRSQEQTREEAEAAFYRAVLRQLVPDQARILAALSDGSRYPLIDVVAGSRLGWGMRPVLTCVSSVGRSAGVQCPELTPAYVQGLLGLGLVVVHDQAHADVLKYELLETEVQVRRTMDHCKQAGMGCRIVRRSVGLTALGTQFWMACRPQED